MFEIIGMVVVGLIVIAIAIAVLVLAVKIALVLLPIAILAAIVCFFLFRCSGDNDAQKFGAYNQTPQIECVEQYTMGFQNKSDELKLN